jgi:hypothetical protein
MTVSKGLVLPVVEMLGVGQVIPPRAITKKRPRGFYVAATRATQWLVVKAGGGSGFGKRLQP